MFLYLNKRDQQHQQQQQLQPQQAQQQGYQYSEVAVAGTRRRVLESEPESDLLDEIWGSPLDMQPQQQQQQQQQQQFRRGGLAAKPAATAAPASKAKTVAYYPEKHPMHPEDSRFNVKWPRSRGNLGVENETQTRQEPHGQTQIQTLTQTLTQTPDARQALWHQQVPPGTGRSPPQRMLMQPPPPPQQPPLLPLPPSQPPTAATAEGMPQRRYELAKFDHRSPASVRLPRSLLPPQPPPMLPPQLLQLPPSMMAPEVEPSSSGGWQLPEQPTATAARGSGPGELADQHLHRLFEEIYAIRGEAETVQYKYRRERDAWAYENAALQARLAELAEQLRERSDQLAALDAAYSDEVESLRSENRDLHLQIQEDRLEAAAGRGSASGGDRAAAERQVDELMAELYALKRELEKLQNRYRKEREKWAAGRRDMQQAIDDLIAGRDPKAVQKRLAQLSAADTAAAAAADEAPPGLDGGQEDLAQASMNYYSSANAMKKEKAVLELELDDEKRKNRVLEIEVEVLRDQVMRTQNKLRGLPEDAEVGGGGAEDGGVLEKGSLETPEKRTDARRASAVPGSRAQDPAESQQQLSQLKRDAEQTAAKLEDAQNRKEAVQQKLSEAKEELRAVTAEKDQAVEESARLKEENQRRRDENRRMREELARVGEQEEKEKEGKRRDAEEKERLQNENRDLKDKLEKLRRENDDEIDRLRMEKRKLEEKLRGIRDKMQDGQKNYKHFQGEFEELAKMCGD